jgi:hypothetical protein
VLGVYERVGRLITPSASAWARSGDVLAAMMRDEALELSRVSRSFSNDILLALSCREAGCVLVTENHRDFSRIQRFFSFRVRCAVAVTAAVPSSLACALDRRSQRYILWSPSVYQPRADSRLLKPSEATLALMGPARAESSSGLHFGTSRRGRLQRSQGTTANSAVRRG